MPKIWDQSVASHKARLRAAVVEAAVVLVAERGRGSVSMSAVAERAGIGRATLYNYFTDVDHILAAHVIGEFTEQNARLDDELAALDDPIDRLRALVASSVGYLGSPRHERGAAGIGTLDQFAPDVQRLVDQAVEGFRRRLAAVVADAVGTGQLRADLDPTFLTHGLEHLLAAARTSMLAGEQGAGDATDAVLALFLDGAGTRRR